MIDYTGKTCHCCGKVFDDNDDIVVCPDCGTPYHRECYRQSGCTNIQLHKTHGSWASENADAEESGNACKNCGETLRSGARFCDKCGTPVNGGKSIRFFRNDNGSNTAPPEYNTMYGSYKSDRDPYNDMGADMGIPFTSSPDEELEDGVTVGEVSAFVGDRKQYYIPRFLMMKKLGMKFSFNIAAFFFPEAYLAYRKMNVAAILLFIVRFAILLPYTAVGLASMLSVDQNFEMFSVLLQDYPRLLEAAKIFAGYGKDAATMPPAFTTLSMISQFINTTTQIVMCLFANFMYYRYCISSVSLLKKEKMDGLLEQAGGTSVLGLIIFLFLIAVRSSVSMFLLLYITAH